jgi:kynurenine formamidase
MRLPAWSVGWLVVAAFGLGWVISGGTASGKKEDPATSVKGWVKGKGWGGWGKKDEVGALNAITPQTIKAALGLVKKGQVYDLGVPYDKDSFKWPGHSAAEIIMYRSPEGIKRQGDFAPVVDPEANRAKMAWHTCAVFINDNVGTQIDGLGHVTTGADNHWYNGFKEADWGGNFGIRKCDATTIPPIITRGVLIDVAGYRKVDALPAHYEITADDLQGALRQQKTALKPGDTVLVRTGELRYWGKNGANHDKLREHDSAGINLKAARWLVEQKGAILVGADTSGLEHWPDTKKKKAPFIPVHRYLLIEQGVHIGEFHFLEDLARDKVYEFCYVCMTNKIRGTTAGFTLRPIALR